MRLGFQCKTNECFTLLACEILPSAATILKRPCHNSLVGIEALDQPDKELDFANLFETKSAISLNQYTDECSMSLRFLKGGGSSRVMPAVISVARVGLVVIHAIKFQNRMAHSVDQVRTGCALHGLQTHGCHDV